MNKPLTNEHSEVRERTDEDIATMRFLSETLPRSFQRTIGQRGEQRLLTKIKTSMRISSEVIQHFKAEGPGWQTCIDQTLNIYESMDNLKRCTNILGETQSSKYLYGRPMKKLIPAPVISVLSDNMPNHETHSSLDSLFLYAEAPGEPPTGSKPKKIQDWLRRVNKESDNPLAVLGRLIENYMESPRAEENLSFGDHTPNEEKKLKTKIEEILSKYNLKYFPGGIILDGSSAPSRTLADLIKKRDFPAIDTEFNRALENVNSEPREAVSAACNILESIFKTYISDEKLVMPQKQDLQSVWKVVRSDLRFNPSALEDDDLKKIISGIFSVVDGIGAFRTHASSAHGQGRKIYNLKNRHARLAINSAHTIALFVLETWNEKKSITNKTKL